MTDAAILSTIVDGTVLVVRAFKTTKEMARHAHRVLLDLGAPRAGAVLNAVNFSRHEYRYTHYYYHRGYYGDAAAAASKSVQEAESPPAH